MTTASPDSGSRRFPARYADVATNRERYRDLVDRLAPHFFRSDPLADEVVTFFASLPPGRGKAWLDQALDHGVASIPDAPAPLVRFFEAVDHVPLWVDWDRINLGGETYLRAGVLGAGALLCYSLPWGYLSPGANKPLVFSGRLVQRAYRRLLETSRFVLETCLPDGMRRHGAGFKVNVRVRIMHAQVRRLLWTSGRWREDEWGAPINQCDLLSGNLLFSIIVIDALTRTGFL
ncbi:MAG TPA: oxygenase MpaB family protein, partial [Methylomirabilota bacterium]